MDDSRKSECYLLDIPSEYLTRQDEFAVLIEAIVSGLRNKPTAIVSGYKFSVEDIVAVRRCLEFTHIDEFLTTIEELVDVITDVERGFLFLEIIYRP